MHDVPRKCIIGNGPDQLARRPTYFSNRASSVKLSFPISILSLRIDNNRGVEPVDELLFHNLDEYLGLV